MKTNFKLLTIFALFIVTHFTTSTFGQSSGNQPEKLFGFNCNPEAGVLSITVSTNGCTSAKDFQFKINGANLTIIRTNKDYCKAVPRLIIFTYKMKDIGLNPNKTYSITNKLYIGGGLGTAF